MNLTPLKAIRIKCLECCCDSSHEVKNCHITDCPLWPYRLGRKLTATEAAEYTGEGTPSLKSDIVSAQKQQLAKEHRFSA
jgi:hypothetical protein